MKNVTYNCDNCGKPLHYQFANTISIYYYQGYPFNDVPSQFDRQWLAKHWRHKEVCTKMLCNDCLGDVPDQNNGVSFDWKKVARKVGLLKEETKK